MAEKTARAAHSGTPGAREIVEELDCVVLPARLPGGTKPPVRIFLGTEPAQYRANRVFVYSIEKVRDPAREVRIYMMSEMPGFNRRLWTTGFTNYRFALPALAGGEGRAIYNDEDQIYLTDPGVLFDMDLGSAGHLSISDTESSVMLVDCERMAPVWTLEEARTGWKRDLLRKASKETGHRGDLDPGWNARDEEFRPGESHLLHYTTLHTQPWRPFPERFVYQKGSHTELWHELEREAIAEGFELFQEEAPSRAFSQQLARLRALPLSDLGSGIGLTSEMTSAVENLVRRTKSARLTEMMPEVRGLDAQRPGRFGLDAEERAGLLEWLEGNDPNKVLGEPNDGVVCVDGLESLPVGDLPWLIEGFFARAKRFVFVAVRCPESPPRRRLLFPPAGTTHTPAWWRSHFEAASVRHPEVSWVLLTALGKDFAPDRVEFHRGGARADATPPRVWTLTDGAPGNEAQVEALASALGWPAEALRPTLSPIASLPFSGQGVHLGTLAAKSRDRAALKAPWPELLIVAGRKAAPVARWIRKQSRGETYVVALGAKAATPAADVDLAVTPSGATLFPHPNRLEIESPLIASPSDSQVRIEGAGASKLESIPHPRLVLLVGSGTHRLGLDREKAEALGRLVADSAESLGASVLVTVSQHASPEVVEGCLSGLGRVAYFQQSTANQQAAERTWPLLLQSADLFVMVGLGEATLAEICSTSKPVFLSPQVRDAKGFLEGLRDGMVDSVVRRAEARPENDRGTTRPQQGLELICAKWVERGWVRPRRDVEALRGRLVRSGRARLLRAPIRPGDLSGFAPAIEPATERVAQRVRRALGVRLDTEGE